jgi:hypothetical protein
MKLTTYIAEVYTISFWKNGGKALCSELTMEDEELLAWEIAKWLIEKMGLIPQESFYRWAAVSLETYGYGKEEALRKLKESNIDI